MQTSVLVAEAKARGLESPGVYMILRERRRQSAAVGKGGKGYCATHDDCHTNGELAMAASDYAAGCPYLGEVMERAADVDERIVQLVKAGALIAAEIDRLVRAEERKATPLDKSVEPAGKSACATTCDSCNGMRARVYPDTPIGHAEVCRECGGKGVAV